MTLIELSENIGSPGGSNVGIRHALERGCDYVFLLNNDTTVRQDCVRRLVEAAEDEGASRILCPLVCYADPPDLIWYAGSTWDPAKIYNGGYHGRGERDIGQFDGVRPTGVATGAAVLVAREVFERVGLLDDRLFLQADDVEFSARATRAGFGVSVVSNAKSGITSRPPAGASSRPSSPTTACATGSTSPGATRGPERCGGRRSRRASSASCSPMAAAPTGSWRARAPCSAVGATTTWGGSGGSALEADEESPPSRRLPLALRAWATTRQLPAFKGRTRVAALIARRSIDPLVGAPHPPGHHPARGPPRRLPGGDAGGVP